MQAWNKALIAVVAAAAALTAGWAHAQQANSQFIGITGYRVGPYGANGAAFLQRVTSTISTSINERDGGINGVKLVLGRVPRPNTTNAKGVECYERLKSSRNGPTRASDVKRHHLYALSTSARPSECRRLVGINASAMNWTKRGQ
jgi:hypothetical protein